VNYYERHLGDYARDAGHLTMLEHGAYTLLLDRYYTTEQGIPADQAHRICRARTRDEKEAVDTVLAEFFTLRDGVHHQKRVDAEIERYSESAPDREAKRENERDRQRRTRERRKELFDLLRANGIVPAYDAPMSELQAAASRIKSQPVTPPVTRDDTATHTPDTSYSVPKGTGGKPPPPTDRDVVFAAGVAMLTVAGVTDKNARSFLAMQCKAHGEAAVRAALDRAAEERPIEPITWLQATLKAKPAGPAKSKFIADREAQASRWIGSAVLPGMGGEIIDLEDARNGAAPAIR
jgi:uncharacterized protein YdaU (DUF1376 family)